MCPASQSVFAQLIRNRNARHGNHTVGEFEEYVNGVHRANLGCNSVRASAPTFLPRPREADVLSLGARRQGWDRYLDMHLGVWCSRPEYLDRIGPKMCETGVGFHSHRGDADYIGSIWSAGVGSLGVEFHGSFDGTFFNESELTTIDYCSATSSGTCAHHKC